MTWSTWCICGSRTATRTGSLWYLDALSIELGDPTTVISGGARGADAIGEEWARRNGIRIERYNADWTKHGRAAGPIRNRQMAIVVQERQGLVVALWDGQSAGTRNMIETSRQLGVTVRLCDPSKIPFAARR